MKNIDIIYSEYLDAENKIPTIGGVQTYITDLIDVCIGKGKNVRIIQFSDKDFQCEMPNGATVIGVKVSKKRNKKDKQVLYDTAMKSRKKDTLTIIASHYMIPPKLKGKNVGVQHGVYWDIPRMTRYSKLCQICGKAYRAYQCVKDIEKLDKLVCVDYNFLNWYRTQLLHITTKITVIPNYAEIAPLYSKPQDRINIIFARRLFGYRGTYVFTKAIKRILGEGYDINATVAGSGPDENWMKEELREFKNVDFIKYSSEESIEVHRDKHIAVIPTLGSEGTSLSLLEAMSAQCAVICTDVGGMTNIVLDGFNGIMIPAGNVDELYIAIRELLENPQKRQFLTMNGYETIKAGFSYEKWKNSWTKIIEEADENE